MQCESSMKTASRPSARRQRFEDISALRARLPRYWWAEVSRVRKLIAADAESGLFEAEHFVYVAEALRTGAEQLAREHAVALWDASRKLTAIAQVQAAQA